MTKKNEEDRIRKITGNYYECLHERLKNKKHARMHLQVAMDMYQEDQNKEALLLALKDVAQAQGGIAWLAEETALNREHLYYLLSGKGNPRLDTISLILQAFGMRLKVTNNPS